MSRPSAAEWEGLDSWAVVRTQKLAHDIRQMASEGAAGLVGVAWGLKGVLGLGESGLEAEVRGRPWTPAEGDRAVAAACWALDRFLQIAGGDPGSQVGGPVRELNPAAGTHRITTDPLELEAALRAGERSLQRFPYYRLRFGDRGVAFTRSDSAWLVTLCHTGSDLALSQLLWLGGLLSVRGMPRWLLEDHIEVLNQELRQVCGGAASRYGTLLELSSILREMRTRHMPDHRISEVDRRFRTEVGPELAVMMPSAGALLAAAAADTADGMVAALPSVSDWLADPDRFPPSWIAAVQMTLEALPA